MARPARRSLALSASAALLLLLVAGCGGSSSSAGASPSGGNKGTLTIAGFGPFSGPDAAFGPNLIAGCYPATRLINAAGGVLGHNLSCKPVDTKGDPADAVPAARQLLATTPSLVFTIGPSSDEATATVPIFNQSQIPMMATTGQVAFDNNHFPYFWRNTPADNQDGYAMALYAHEKGYTRAAAVFNSDIAGTGENPTVTRGFQELGGKLVDDEVLPSGATSYSTEVQRLINAKPQVIFMDFDPPSASVFLSELKQLHGMIPVIATGASVEPNWLHAIAHAIGPAELFHYVTGIDFYAPASGSTWALYKKSILASAANVPDPAQWLTDPYAMTFFDGTTAFALAMQAANSTKGSAWNHYIPLVTEHQPGAVVVHTFAQGKAALLAGKKIQFIGVTGPMSFNNYHNSTGEFGARTYTGFAGSTPSTKITAVLSSAQLAALNK